MPSFFFSARAIAPRTVCGCHSRASAISSMVTPFARRSMAMSCACLLPSRVRRDFGSLVLDVFGRCFGRLRRWLLPHLPRVQHLPPRRADRCRARRMRQEETGSSRACFMSWSCLISATIGSRPRLGKLEGYRALENTSNSWSMMDMLNGCICGAAPAAMSAAATVRRTVMPRSTSTPRDTRSSRNMTRRKRRDGAMSMRSFSILPAA